MPEIRVVLLDMDGTLVDSNAAVARAWAYWSALRSVSRAEIARVTPGRPASESIAELAPWLSPAERAADAEELLRRERADVVDIVPTRGALDLVAALRAWAVPHAVVTSADRALARIRLTAAGIEVPPVLVTSDDIGRGKPDPEGYLVAAGRLGVAPEDCLVVEDAPVGVRAGRAAGALVAGLAGVPGADLDVPDLDALRERLSPTGAGTLLLDDRHNFPEVVASRGA
jgi:mannitol-1-/sugar-/sorbitol-6-phosphatase